MKTRSMTCATVLWMWMFSGVSFCDVLTGSFARGAALNDCNDVHTVYLGSSSAAASCSYVAPDYFAYASASAAAEFGRLRATSHAEVGGIVAGIVATSQAQAVFDDVLILTDVPINAVAVDLRGTLSGNAAGLGQGGDGTTITLSQGGVLVLTAHPGSHLESQCTFVLLSGIDSCHVIAPIPVDNLIPISLFLSVQSLAGITETRGGTPIPYAVSDADFYDTGLLSGITLLDENGLPVSGATIRSQSGTSYPILSDIFCRIYRNRLRCSFHSYPCRSSFVARLNVRSYKR